MTTTRQSNGLPNPPREDDVLFGPVSDDWQLNACVSPYTVGRNIYKVGYRKAAYELILKMCEDPRDQDYLVYPIVFLYRHHIELVLKDLLQHSTLFLDEKINEKTRDMIYSCHKLDKLWNKIRPRLNEICKRAGDKTLPVKDLKGVSSYIEQLSKVDPQGDRFRYELARDNKLASNPMRNSLAHLDIQNINIRQYATHMETLSDYLDALVGWVSWLYEASEDLKRSNN